MNNLQFQTLINDNESGAPPPCIAPTFTTAVAIDGDTIIGATLSVSDNGQPSGTAPITITYQWNLNGTPIGGATADTYEVQPADAGGNITCTVTATNACGSVSDVSNTIAIAAAPALLLDSYAVNTAYGWSVARQLKTSATSAITIRRSSDNATQTIGFVAGELDTAAIATFVGANSAYITTIYEQNGSGYNFTQSTAANQPRIVNAGTLEVFNTKACMTRTGTNTIGMSVPSSTGYFKFIHDGTNSSTFIVQAFRNINTAINFRTNNGSAGVVGYYDQNTSLRQYVSIGNGSGTTSVFANTGAVFTANAQYLISCYIDADNATASDRCKIYVNGGAGLGSNSQTAAPSAANAGLDLGLWLDAANVDGKFQELILFPSQPTLSDIRTNINNFYNIY